MTGSKPPTPTVGEWLKRRHITFFLAMTFLVAVQTLVYKT